LVRRVSGTFDYEITERGRAFPEIIGPEGEAPEIVGRWSSEAGVIPRAAVEPMDDWLLAFFGHLKGRLIRLGSGSCRGDRRN
jgi:hypothetical protein